MTIRTESLVFDTNIWIFGLRRHPEYPFCTLLLESLGQLSILIPRQIVRELQVNLMDSELKELFHLLNQLEGRITINWEKARMENIRKYQVIGCKLGDAIVAAHLEEFGVKTLISENRHFLNEIKDLPFRCINSGEALLELGTYRF